MKRAAFIWITLLAFVMRSAPAEMAPLMTKKINICLNTGLQTDSILHSPLWTWEIKGSIRVHRSLQISPEFMFSTEFSLNFRNCYINPGIMVNYVAKKFFIGAGATMLIKVAGWTRNKFSPALKINAGLIFNRGMFTVYAVPWTDYRGIESNSTIIGASIGFLY